MLCFFPQVLRDYDAFEKLQNDILQQFPSLKLPNLPRKFHLFVSPSDIEERQMSFDCLLTVLSRNADICTSIPLLQFLGVDLLGDRKYHKMRKEYLEKQEQMAEQLKAREEQIIGHLKDGEEDLFAEVVEASSGATNTAEQRDAEDVRQSGTSDLFGGDVQHSSLFETKEPRDIAKTETQSKWRPSSCASNLCILIMYRSHLPAASDSIFKILLQHTGLATVHANSNASYGLLFLLSSAT